MIHIKGLNNFELAVINKLLDGDHPILNNLRLQASEALLVKREYTGVGFYCHFKVSSNEHTLREDIHNIGGVNAEIEGLNHGAGFILFITHGQLDLLECYTYDEPWPKEIGKFTLSYNKEPRDFSNDIELR